MALTTPADILTAVCTDGYDLVLCESNTENEVWTDNELEWCRMIVEDKMQNRLNIECEYKQNVKINKADILDDPKILLDDDFSPANVMLHGIKFGDTIENIPSDEVDSVVESVGWVHLKNGASYRLSESGSIVEFALHEQIINKLGILRRDEMEFKFGKPDKIEEDTLFDIVNYDYYYYDKGIIVRWWEDEITLINIIEK